MRTLTLFNIKLPCFSNLLYYSVLRTTGPSWTSSLDNLARKKDELRKWDWPCIWGMREEEWHYFQLLFNDIYGKEWFVFADRRTTKLYLFCKPSPKCSEICSKEYCIMGNYFLAFCKYSKSYQKHSRQINQIL